MAVFDEERPKRPSWKFLLIGLVITLVALAAVLYFTDLIVSVLFGPH